MSVRKRNQHWQVDFRYRGKRYRQNIEGATNKSQALKAEARLKTDLFEEHFGDGKKSERLVDFIEQVYRPWARTKRSYKADAFFLKAICDYFGSFRLNEISPISIEAFKRKRLATPVQGTDKPRRPASVNREFSCLSKILSMACDNGLLATNPCRKVKRLREDNTRTRYLTDEEETRLFAAITTKWFERIRPLIILALETGMRQGEICGLKWSAVDWNRNLILVTDTKSGVDRAIPMTKVARALLTERWQTHRSGVVFSLKPGAVSNTFFYLSRAAGLVDVTFHTLRHTFATRLAPHTDAFTLAALLGHKTLAMTARYTHATDGGKRAAIEALERRGNVVEFRREA